MDSRWLSHLSKDPLKKEEFKNHILACKPVLERLKSLLTKEVQASQKKQKDIDLYNSPNWELHQVDCNASQRTLEKVMDFLEV